MTRYTMRATARLVEKDVHRWPFCLDDLGGVDDMGRGMI